MRRLLHLAFGLWVALAACARAEPVAFSLDAPAAREVFLAGEMTAWDEGKRPMLRGEDGVWRVTIDLAPGQWLYKFVVDGRWVHDPATSDHDADGRGGQHSFVFVGDGPWRVPPGAPRGEVRVHRVDSKALRQAMTVNVYLPPRYRQGQALPVLWLLHGGGMDADQWFKTGHVERYLDHLLATGQVRPFVIVMPSGGRQRAYDGASETFVSRELPEWLAAEYGLRPGRARSALAGMSLGGYGTVALALRHPAQYGFGYALAGWYPPELVHELGAASALTVPLVLRCGAQDELVATNRELVKALKQRGAMFDYQEAPGGHTAHFWSQYTAQMLGKADEFFRQAGP